MRLQYAYQLGWTAVEEALRDVLDNSTITVEREEDLYTAYDESNDIGYDAGQVDERIAQYLGLERVTGYLWEDGIVFLSEEPAKAVIVQRRTGKKHERFALLPSEFIYRYPDAFEPDDEPATVVRTFMDGEACIRYKLAVLGGPEWEEFFDAEMAEGSYSYVCETKSHMLKELFLVSGPPEACAEPVWLGWDDLTEDEKQQAVESYRAIREQEEETPCSRERAESETPCCRFERTSDGYIYVDV